MNRKRMMVLLAAGTLTLASMNITMVMAEDTDTAVFAEDGTPVSKTVKAYELNFPSQDLYDFPYMGLQFSLPDELKKQLNDK